MPFSAKQLREQARKRGHGCVAEMPGKWKLLRMNDKGTFRYFKQEKGNNPVEVEPDHAYDLFEEATKRHMNAEKAFPTHIVEGKPMRTLADRLRKVASKVEGGEKKAAVDFDLLGAVEKLGKEVGSFVKDTAYKDITGHVTEVLEDAGFPVVRNSDIVDLDGNTLKYYIVIKTDPDDDLDYVTETVEGILGRDARVFKARQRGHWRVESLKVDLGTGF